MKSKSKEASKKGTDMMAGISAIFISAMLIFSADAYLYGFVFAVIGTLILPWKSIVFLSYFSKIYAVLFVLTTSFGILFPYFMTPETPDITIGLYIFWVYLWVLFSEKIHKKYNAM